MSLVDEKGGHRASLQEMFSVTRVSFLFSYFLEDLVVRFFLYIPVFLWVS